jgi:bifunctional enzyme CysN/CysC
MNPLTAATDSGHAATEPVAAGPAPPDLAAAGLLRIATAGSVDDGKSTLIGRLLYDAKQVLEDQIEAVERTSRRRGGGGALDLSLLVDGLRAEREQGITIDVAYRYFATARRRFIVADTPGHVQYTRNMVTGASTADVALVLIDARRGVVEQSRRHAFIAALLGIRSIVACVNKMDLVAWDRERFEEIAADLRAVTGRLGVPEPAMVPLSALHGDNVVERSGAAGWYEGPALLELLEDIDPPAGGAGAPARFPVQWVIRPGAGESRDYRGYAGQVAAGTLRPGDEIAVLPAGGRSRIRRIDTWDGPVAEAAAPMSVTLLLDDDLEVSRGDLICRAGEEPATARDVEADVCWMAERPLEAGRRYLLKHTTRCVRAGVEAVRHRIDMETLAPAPAEGALALNDIGRVVLRTSAPLAFDPYAEARATGALILIDEATNETVAAGMLTGPGAGRDAAGASAPRSANVTWHRGRLDRVRRREALGARGATLWFTGLPASGKSTIAAALEERLVGLGVPAYLLDGDNLRHGLNGDLCFDAAARAENVRRTAEVARLMADAGTVALVSLVSPYEADRRRAREIHDRDGLDFLEVWVATPLAECEARDPKGLYARARAGEITGFTGIDDPYEAPAAPDVEVGRGEDVERAVERLAGALRAHGLA